MTLSNVTLSGNTASTYSGGISPPGQWSNPTDQRHFSNNTAQAGGAMTLTAVAKRNLHQQHDRQQPCKFSIRGIADYGTVSMVNTILYGNDGANCGIGGTLTSLGYNIDGAQPA